MSEETKKPAAKAASKVAKPAAKTAAKPAAKKAAAPKAPKATDTKGDKVQAVAAKLGVTRRGMVTAKTRSFNLTAEAALQQQQWLLIDADGVVLGRLAAYIASVLRGKHKPTFTPSVQGGDKVIVINAEKVKLTGKKLTDKIFYYHTGHPGGIKERSFGSILGGKYPERLVEKAVERMITRGALGRKLMTNLRVYKGSEHPHAAQNPKLVNFASMNPKNKRAA